jgi:hypothetical protein
VHSGPFGCLTKLGAKWAKLVQKFVPRSGFGIFRNERTRSTPLDPKLSFWCVRTIWVHSERFGSLMKLGAKRAELVQKFVPRSRVGIFRNERTRSTLLNPKVHFVVFVCIRDHLVALGNPVQNGRNWCKSSCHEVASQFFATNELDPPHWTPN